jgi:hypothetical protein
MITSREITNRPAPVPPHWPLGHPVVRARKVVTLAALATCFLSMPALSVAAEARRPGEAGSIPSVQRAGPAGSREAGRAETAVEREASARQAAEYAENATGLSADALMRMAERESRFNASARNPRSTATGLMQVNRASWLEAVRDHGAKHGLAHYASQLRTDRQGNITARNPRVIADILRLRNNPQLSAGLASERMAAARAAAETTLGRRATPADLYLVHFLGARGAQRLFVAMRERPQASSVAVVSQAARTNGSVFHQAGRPLTVTRVYQEVAEMFEPGEARTLQRAGRAAPLGMVASSE